MRKQNGLIILPTVIFLSLIIVAILVAMMSSGFLESILSQSLVQTSQSFYLADAGIDDALLKIARDYTIVQNSSLAWRLPVSEDGHSLIIVSSITSTQLNIYSSGDIFDKLKHLKTQVTIDEYGEISQIVWQEQKRIWYDNSWQYRKMIALNYHQVAGNLLNFPVLISITDSDLKQNANSDGSDIIFTAFDGITKLPREIESYDSTTGQLVAWVKVPFLSAYSPTIVYMYYGNPSAQETNLPAVWDGNYKGVWHKYDLTSSSIKDSSANSYDGTKEAVNQPQEAQGKISKAQNYNNDYIDTADIGAIELHTATISFWAKVASTNRDNGFIYKGAHNTYQPLLIWFDDIVGSGADKGGGNTNAISVLTYDGSIQHWVATPTNSINDTDWHYIVVIIDPPNSQIKIYIDGQLSESNTKTWNGIQNTTTPIRFGNPNPTSANYLQGMIDEVRISDNLRSAEWIRTEYNNQSNPQNFYFFVGSQENY